VAKSRAASRKVPLPQLPKNFIYGINPVAEALAAGQLRRLYLSVAGSPRLAALAERAGAAGIAVQILEEAPWYPALKGCAHQGAAGVTRLFTGALLAAAVARLPEPAAVLLLDGVNDPQNLGAAIRSAAAAGAAVVLPQHHAAPITATVHKASAGLTYRTPVVLGENLAQAMDYLKQRGYWVACLDAHAGESVFRFEFPRRIAFIAGSEERGVRRLLREKSDFRLTIPMQPGVDSLNLGVAAALALFSFRAFWERAG